MRKYLLILLTLALILTSVISGWIQYKTYERNRLRSEIEITIEDSELFSHEEIQDAIDCILDAFIEPSLIDPISCFTPISIEYEEEKCIEEQMYRLHESEIPSSDMIVLSCSFNSGKHEIIGMLPDTVYHWIWTLERKGPHSAWKIKEYGHE
ncbi:MAG: hypothetical protein ACI4JQ_06250 [Ruminococcus sp.]